MEARRKGNWVAAFCAALCLLTTFAAGAWAGDAAKFVSENYQDNTSVAGGTTFTKTWTIKNSGTTTWTSSYKLKYVSGNLSSNQSSIGISGTVKPGNSYTFSVAMKAPAAQSSAKTYREDWKFTNSSGTTVKVGGLSSVWAQIVVPKFAPVVTDDYGNNCSAAADISLNSSKNGKIDLAGDLDYFRIKVLSKGDLKVFSDGSTDVDGRLLDSNCKEIARDDETGTGDNFRIFKEVPAATYYVAVLPHSSTKTGSYTLTVSFAKQVDGWSDVTGYRHAETAVQQAIIAEALRGGNNRPSPQSIIGSPWQTDIVNGDGANMRLAVQTLHNYWVSRGKPRLPFASIPINLQNSMRTQLGIGYQSVAGIFIERIRQVFNGTVPADDAQTLSYLGIRAQCKEFADRTVAAGGGTKFTYGSKSVETANIRPGMYAFKSNNKHATIVVAVKWANGQPTHLRLAESNWGTGWANPDGQIPWQRTISVTREIPVSGYYVVATE